jgi:dTDP-4-amino-4,6-dideoxygalactose transaminase
VRAALGRVPRDARSQLTNLLKREYAASGVVLCGSGTQALQLAIAAAWRRGEARGCVALPAFGCFDLAAAAVGANVPVCFFDLEPATLSPDLRSLEGVLQGGATVVVIAPLYGMPVNWEAVAALCERHGAIVIEDAAQGHGASWRDRPLGCHGELSILSFGRGKGWTGGGGGAMLTRGAGWPEADTPPLTPSSRMDDARTVLALTAQWTIGRPSVYRVPASLSFLRLGETVYHEPEAPRSMSRAAAALALDHHQSAESSAIRRKEVAELWREDITAGPGIVHVGAVDHAEPGYLRFPLLLARGMRGFAVLSDAARAGIAASYPIILPDLPAIRDRHNSRGSWPGATALTRSLVTLPTHQLVADDDRLRVLELISSYSLDER